MRSPEVDLQKYIQLSSDKWAKAIQRENIVVSTNGAEHSWTSICNNNKPPNQKIDINFNNNITEFTFPKINSKWIIDLNIKCKTI